MKNPRYHPRSPSEPSARTRSRAGTKLKRGDTSIERLLMAEAIDRCQAIVRCLKRRRIRSTPKKQIEGALQLLRLAEFSL